MFERNMEKTSEEKNKSALVSALLPHFKMLSLFDLVSNFAADKARCAR